LVSVSATTTSSDVVNLIGCVGGDVSWLVFDFPGENLSGSSEGRRRRFRHRILFGGVALEIILICFTCEGSARWVIEDLNHRQRRKLKLSLLFFLFVLAHFFLISYFSSVWGFEC
jgi:hypothetical protein